MYAISHACAWHNLMLPGEVSLKLAPKKLESFATGAGVRRPFTLALTRDDASRIRAAVRYTVNSELEGSELGG